jgi:hypothetical protein
MAAEFVAYIDEAGDEGFRFESRSSEWFVLSALVVQKARDLETVKVIDVVRETLNVASRKVLHFRELKHHHRLPYLDAIASIMPCTINILVHKPSLRQVDTFKARYRLYFYTTRYLLERVSWYCRDSRQGGSGGDGHAELVFSNRAGMSYEEMRTYFRSLAEDPACSIEWSIVRSEEIVAYTADKRMGLQLADAVASSFYCAVEPRFGYTEPRYVHMLRDTVYGRNGRCLKYGVKLVPIDCEATFDADPRPEWVRQLFTEKRGPRVSGSHSR